MLSYAAQEYVSKMLGVYLEDGKTTTFKIIDIGTDQSVWNELENAGIVKLFPKFGTVEYDPYADDTLYPSDTILDE